MSHTSPSLVLFCSLVSILSACSKNETNTATHSQPPNAPNTVVEDKAEQACVSGSEAFAGHDSCPDGFEMVQQTLDQLSYDPDRTKHQLVVNIPESVQQVTKPMGIFVKHAPKSSIEVAIPGGHWKACIGSKQARFVIQGKNLQYYPGSPIPKGYVFKVDYCAQKG